MKGMKPIGLEFHFGKQCAIDKDHIVYRKLNDTTAKTYIYDYIMSVGNEIGKSTCSIGISTA